MPTADVRRAIVFDGHCHVCSGWVQFFLRHHVEPPFEMIPMQSAEGRTLLAHHGIDPDDPATFLVLDRGRQWVQSAAALHVVAELGGAWRAVTAFRVVPEAWRDALYGLLARNRYRWFGRRAVCYLPPTLPSKEGLP